MLLKLVLFSILLLLVLFGLPKVVTSLSAAG